MPKILDLQLKTSSLILRLIVGLITAAVSFILLYYIPANLSSLMYSFGIRDEIIINLVRSLVNPVLPTIGLAVAVLELVSAIMRGSKTYGPITLVLGLLFTSYVYLLFQQGAIVIPLSASIYPGISGALVIQLTNLMLLFMLPFILMALKGITLTYYSMRSSK